MKTMAFLLFGVLFQASPRYLIIVGDITCKSCVHDLAACLAKRAGKDRYSIVVQDKGNLIVNETRISYFKSEADDSIFNLSSDSSLFPKDQKYPYVLKVMGSDTLYLPYDLLFRGIILNSKMLK